MYQTNPTYFRRRVVQRGNGLGNIFKGLSRFVVPLAKKGAQYLGKTAVEVGKNVINDVSNGKSIKESMKNNLKKTGKTILQDTSTYVESSILKKPRVKRKKTPLKNQRMGKSIKRNKISAESGRQIHDIYS